MSTAPQALAPWARELHPLLQNDVLTVRGERPFP